MHIIDDQKDRGFHQYICIHQEISNKFETLLKFMQSNTKSIESLIKTGIVRYHLRLGKEKLDNIEKP